MDESNLIYQSKQGDLDAFNELVLEYQRMAFNVAYRIMGDRDKAEDATQDAFVSAFVKLKSFKGGSFKAWLMRIVTNACYDELRKTQRRPTVSLKPNVNDDEELDSPNWLVDTGESPEDNVMRRELSKAIQNCLDRLEIEFRKIVIFIDIQGMDYKEASEIEKTPLGTIKSRLARGRGKMKDCLKGVEELLPANLR